MLQAVLQCLFHVAAFAYVDDCYWVAFDGAEQHQLPTAAWMQSVFHEVVVTLLGWRLDADKCQIGTELTWLGLRIELRKDPSTWMRDSQKANECIRHLEECLENNILLPSEASKMCGRLAFLNTHVFNRIGRALLRPLIWRQLQNYGPYSFSQRLRFVLQWFRALLHSQLSRSIPYRSSLATHVVLLYTDAESSGHISAVAIRGPDMMFFDVDVPTIVRRRLHFRKTQIVAFELIAGIVGIDTFQHLIGPGGRLIHFVDSRPALNI